eukprot:jgi/Mesvir1/28050/Mv04651-RA.1
MTELKPFLEILLEKKDLTSDQAEQAVMAMLGGADPVQTSAFLALLRMKGECAAELAGMAKGMRNNMVHVDVDNGEVLDIVGTGGDGANTVNISTGSCILAAACGAKVAKHGNRASSSACGSADVLEALGVALDFSPEHMASCVRDAGIGFMMAPLYHPAMAAVGPTRKAMKIRTAFNLMGPLLNPAAARYTLLGVCSQHLVPLMADTMLQLGTRRTLVVHCKGLDELSPMGPARAYKVTPNGARAFDIEPLEFGIKRCTVEDLKGGDKFFNAAVLRETLGGKKCAVADALILNAGAGLYTCGVVKELGEGIAMAREVQESGRALATLDRWVEISQSYMKSQLASKAR